MMTSIHDVARETGVSTATVSRALRGLPNVSPATRAAVQRAAESLGYVASSSASGLASGRHHAIAVVVPTTQRWYYSGVLEGADAEFRARHYDVFLVNLGGKYHDRERLFHSALLRKRADAVLALGLNFSSAERREFRSIGLPTIMIGGPVRGIRSIGIDEVAAARMATEHLLDLGHSRIGHFTGDDELPLQPTIAMQRRRGWEGALLDRHIEPNAAWVTSGDFNLPSSHIAALRLLERADRPSAIFAASDEMAYGVLLAAAELGISVPGELSVVGIDDHPYSASFGLSTVRQDPQGQGALGARILLEELDGGSTRARAIKTQLTLIPRRSTAPPA